MAFERYQNNKSCPGSFHVEVSRVTERIQTTEGKLRHRYFGIHHLAALKNPITLKYQIRIYHRSAVTPPLLDRIIPNP